MNTPESSLPYPPQELPRNLKEKDISTSETTSQIAELNRNLPLLNATIKEFQHFWLELQEKAAPRKINTEESTFWDLHTPANKRKKQKLQRADIITPHMRDEIAKATVKKLLREYGEPGEEYENEQQECKRAMELLTVDKLRGIQPKFPTFCAQASSTPARPSPPTQET